MANTIGKTALGVLSGTRQVKVLASVRQAIYLCDHRGELCWVIPQGKPLHRRAVQAAAPVPLVQVGTDYRVENQALANGTQKLLDFSQALVWDPAVDAISLTILPPGVGKSLLQLVGSLLHQAAPTGFGSLIPAIIQSTRHPDLAYELISQDGPARVAWPAVKGIIQAARAGDAGRWIQHARFLVGLGQGLTPSGDDFLGGFIFALQQLSNYYPRSSRIPISTYCDFILQSRSLTNPLSYTILKDHAAGHSVDPLHRLLISLLHGDTVSSLMTYAHQLVSVGHSTGWDILSGFTAGVLSTIAVESL